MYKILKQTINRELDMTAPDIFHDLKNKKIRPIESEKELFSELDERDRSDTASYRGNNFYNTYRNVLGACAAVLMLIIIFCGSAALRNRTTDYVILDINPSICIELTNDHKVKSIYALNEDGKKIVAGITEDETLSTALEKIILEMNKEQYFDGSRAPLLISHCYKKESAVLDKEIQSELNRICADNNIKVSVIYQRFHKDKAADKKARQKGVSVGKYTFVQSLEERYHVDGHALYTANMKDIITKLEQENIDIYVDPSFDVVVNNEQDSEPDSSTTAEQESVTKGNTTTQTEKKDSSSEEKTDAKKDDTKDNSGKEQKENDKEKTDKKDKNDKTDDKNVSGAVDDESGTANNTEIGTAGDDVEGATTETDAIDTGATENASTESETPESTSTETEDPGSGTTESTSTESTEVEDNAEGEFIESTEYQTTEEMSEEMIEIGALDMFIEIPYL
ncbi:MAG: hypothetical protein ACI39Q_05225 [Wujia sp.]